MAQGRRTYHGRRGPSPIVWLIALVVLIAAVVLVVVGLAKHDAIPPQHDDTQQTQLLQQRLSHAFPRSPASGSGSTIRSKSMSRPPIRKKAGKVQSFRKPYRS